MMTKYQLLAVIAVASMPCAAFAENIVGSQSPITGPANPWKINLSGGYVATTGNTSTSTLNFKGGVDWRVDPWANSLNGLATSSVSGGSTTAETYQLSDQLTYDVTRLDYTFASANYLSDRFAGVVERYSQALGYGRHVLNTGSQKLDLDVGIGASEQRVAGSHNLDSQLIAVFDGAYAWKISDSARFKQELHIQAGRIDTFINPVSELKVTIIGNLFAAFNYEVRYNTTVPAGSVHVSTITSVNIGYTFGGNSD